MIVSLRSSTTSVLVSIVLLLLLPPRIRSLATTPNKNSLFAMNARCTLRSEARDEWLAVVRESQLCSRRDEPECLQFVVGQDIDDENVFCMFQLYSDAQAFKDRHCQTPHFETYVSYVRSKKPYACDPEVFFYHPMDEEEANPGATKRPIQKNAFGVNVNLYPRASVREDFLKVISDNKKGTDATEPLALQYTYGEATVRPGAPDNESQKNVFHFHEQYAGKNHGREGFDAHASAPHFAAWEDFVATDPFDKAPEVSFFRVLES